MYGCNCKECGCRHQRALSRDLERFVHHLLQVFLSIVHLYHIRLFTVETASDNYLRIKTKYLYRWLWLYLPFAVLMKTLLKKDIIWSCPATIHTIISSSKRGLKKAVKFRVGWLLPSWPFLRQRKTPFQENFILNDNFNESERKDIYHEHYIMVLIFCVPTSKRSFSWYFVRFLEEEACCRHQEWQIQPKVLALNFAIFPLEGILATVAGCK